MNNLPELISQLHTSSTPAEKANTSKNIENQINWLINNDFAGLVQMLYQVDVDEDKLRLLLQQKQTNDSANLITNIIMERQLKKAELRKETRSETEISPDERW